jgi:hypothetical protein
MTQLKKVPVTAKANTNLGVPHPPAATFVFPRMTENLQENLWQ